MKAKLAFINNPPAVGESEKLQNQSVVKQASAECEDENSTSPTDTAPKEFRGFYKTIYYWIVARH